MYMYIVYTCSLVLNEELKLFTCSKELKLCTCGLVITYRHQVVFSEVVKLYVDVHVMLNMSLVRNRSCVLVNL